MPQAWLVFTVRTAPKARTPLIGDLEVVDPHIQVKLLRWPLVRPAGRPVIGDLLEHQASPAVGGGRDVDEAGALLHPFPAEDGRPEPGGDVGVRAVHRLALEIDGMLAWLVPGNLVLVAQAEPGECPADVNLQVPADRCRLAAMPVLRCPGGMPGRGGK